MNKIICVYKITSPSDKVYIGQTLNYKRRLYIYSILSCKRQLRLYNSFLKYGYENHKFEIIEECSIELLNKRERYWQEYYNVLGEKGLNCKLSNTNAKNALLSDATKTKISKAHKGKILSKETKQKMSISKIGLKKNKCLKVINILNNTIYNSLKEAIEIENILSFSKNSINAACNGTLKTYKKYKWKYKK